MGKKPVYTFAKWRVKQGQLAAVLSQLAELMAKSTAEEGNLLYKVHQSKFRCEHVDIVRRTQR